MLTVENQEDVGLNHSNPKHQKKGSLKMMNINDKLTVGELAEAFCRLPRYKEMIDAFIGCKGYCSEEEFVEEFRCPRWVYEFLFCHSYCDASALAA